MTAPFSRLPPQGRMEEVARHVVKNLGNYFYTGMSLSMCDYRQMNLNLRLSMDRLRHVLSTEYSYFSHLITFGYPHFRCI